MFRNLFVILILVTAFSSVAESQMREFSGRIDRVNKGKFIVDNRMGDKVTFVNVEETKVVGGKDDWKNLKKGDWVRVSWSFTDKPRKAYIISVESNENNVSEGKILYDTNCVSCHGVAGKGDGPVGSVLIPKPRNFAVGDFVFDADEDGEVGSDEDIKLLIKEGAANFGGSALMSPWGLFSDKDLFNLVAYIRTLKQE